MPSRNNRRSEQRTFKGRTLDASLVEHPRSKDYPIEPLLASAPWQANPEATVIWQCMARLDQGSEGACVAFSAMHDYACLPAAQAVTNELANYCYGVFKEHDEWKGEDYSGTSPYGAARGLVAMGVLKEFRWLRSRTVSEFVETIQKLGPVLVATPWPEGMFDTDRNGYCKYEGRAEGAHQALFNGVFPALKTVQFVNSWGSQWGTDGAALMTYEDLEKCLSNPRTQVLFLSKKGDLGKIILPAETKKTPWWKRIFGFK